MRKSLLLTAVLGAIYMPSTSFAEEAVAAAEAPKSAWTASANAGFVSDYYARGLSQSWHKPAVQGGFDLEHESGFSVGVWGSTISPNTFPDATAEIDIYANYGGEFSFVEGLGYSVGLIGYLYPGGSWRKCQGCLDNLGNPARGGRWDTYEANFGLSYGWLSGQVSATLGDWFGAEKATGFKGSSSGTTYIELNAAYPLPWYDLTLVGHVGRLNVTTTLAEGLQGSGGRSPNYTDYKVGLSKSFSFANSEGWEAGVYYVGARDNGYFSQRGFGGPSFNGTGEAKDLADNRWIVSLSRSF